MKQELRAKDENGSRDAREPAPQSPAFILQRSRAAPQREQFAQRGQVAEGSAAHFSQRRQSAHEGRWEKTQLTAASSMGACG